ncbi:protein with RING finger domain at C-terminus [Cryptosporidium sp. chipmunk genotype I]|uniref:protein with RING finger domain at C-terminus n=1 Tax=Cryptosporidium sp. chipmunk genotype I TaxID=1280935 RepID=UPI00351A3ADB|nr:protein with RING finger domain at C-terminus [Cryptosporidium sp. chipmunk genotype I]
MLYEIKVEGGNPGNVHEWKNSELPELFSYEFSGELFDLLLDYDVTAISLSKTLITITTLDNEIIIFKKNQEFTRIGKTQINFRNKDKIFRLITLDENRQILHALSNKDEYLVYKINFFQEKIEAIKIFGEFDIISFFINEVNYKTLLVLKSGKCMIFSLQNGFNYETKIILTNEKIIKNCKINAIWNSKNQTVLWNIGHKLYLYDYSVEKLLLNINLKNYITIDERVSMNRILLHYCEGNIYILVKNKVFLFKIIKNEKEEYVFNFRLIYMMEEVYSAIDASNIEIQLLNSVYTCIMAILSNSKDQINIFIFDSFFRIVKHDIIHCKKRLLKEFRRYKYLNESDYVNMEHLQSVPRFLKLGRNQLLIHKNRNKSFLKMESIGMDEIFITCMKKSIIDHSFFLINCDISKEMETCLIINYIQKNANSIEFVDKVLSKKKVLRDSQQELDLYIDLFSHFGKFRQFIIYLKDSDSFLEMFKEVKDLHWYSNFISMLYKKDIILFYHVIHHLPIQKIIMELDWNNKVYSGLLFFMENNTDLDLKAFGNAQCDHNASNRHQLTNPKDDKDIVYYYLSYFEVLSWVKVTQEQTIVNCLHLLEMIPENEMIQDSIINYFNKYSVNSSSKMRKFIIENASCILNTDNFIIIGILLYNNIIGEYNFLYHKIKDKNKDCFVFLKQLLFYQMNYSNSKVINISDNYKIKICFEEVIDFFNCHLNNIIEIYLKFSVHELLNFTIINFGLFNTENLQYLAEIDTSSILDGIKYDLHSEEKYIIEVKSIAMFLLNNKTDALQLLVDNGLIFSALSLILYLNSDNENLWKQLINMTLKNNIVEPNQLNSFIFWYEYFIYSPNELSEGHIIDFLSKFTFPRSQQLFNILRNDLFVGSSYSCDCCNFHNIPFNGKYLISEVKRLIIECIDSYKEKSRHEYLNNDMKIQEKYLKFQIELACINFDFCNQETNRNIQEYIISLPRASSLNYNTDICLLCNSKLFFLKNKKLSSKVILNHCKHNYHYECYLKHVYIYEKSYKFKTVIENSISKNNIKCIICQYKLLINHHY